MRAYRESVVARQVGPESVVESLGDPLELPAGIDSGVSLRFTIRITTGLDVQYSITDMAMFQHGRAGFLFSVAAAGFPYDDAQRNALISELAERSVPLQ
jgi:hypothetical protein